MTMQFHSTYQMELNAGNALMAELGKRLQNLEKTKALTDKRYTQWSSVAAKPAPSSANEGAAPILGMIFSSFFETLFGGMPIMQAFDGMVGDSMQGLGTLGVMGAEDGAHASLQRTGQINHSLKSARIKQHGAASKRQADQMEMLRMMMHMMMNMMAEQNGDASGEGEESLVPDALRDPKMARFKQNRHSISCVRTLFQREAEITAPRFEAPRYNYA